MIINIDLDDTCINLSDTVNYFVERQIGRKINLENKEKFWDIVNKECCDKFFETFIDQICNKVEFYPDCLNSIEKLRKLGHTINFCTVRPYKLAGQTMWILQRHNVKYNQIYFCCGNKVDVCKFTKADIMIDDSADNCRALKKAHIPFIVKDQIWNKSITGELLRADKWSTIYDFLYYYEVDETIFR